MFSPENKKPTAKTENPWLAICQTVVPRRANTVTTASPANCANKNTVTEAATVKIMAVR